MRSAFSPFAIAARLFPAARAPDPLERVRGHARGPAEPHALRAFCRERAPYALRVEPPLERGEGGEHARERFAGGRLRLQGAGEGDEREALLSRAREQGHELEQG